MNEVPTTIFNEYTDFKDIFLLKQAAELFEHIKINDHTIELVDCQQPFYIPIYSLGLLKLETFKIHIENNQANGFIKPSKSFT